MQNINIGNLAGGAIIEQTNLEIEKIVKNIMDINTSPEKKRKLTLEIVFLSDENRDISKITFLTKALLAPQKAISTVIVFDNNNEGELVIEELKTKQQQGQTYYDFESEKVVVPKVVKKILNIK
jgi:hypothetical protein